MEKASTHGVMERYMWGSGSATKCMGMAYCNGPVERDMKGILRMTSVMDKAFSYGKMVVSMMASGKMGNSMVVVFTNK